MTRRLCICGRGAGAAVCRHCQRLTCTYCHHDERHLRTCPLTVRHERPRSR